MRVPTPELAGLLRNVASELGLVLGEMQVEQLATHFALLLKWNEKINLTSVRKPHTIATRHFAESLFLTKLVDAPVSGLMLDIGSGAGFPGLPLKIAWLSVDTILLEPNQKKATFLKEVIRSCRLKSIEVCAERLEQAARGKLAGRAAFATLRAVKASPELLADVHRLLTPSGVAALFVGCEAADQVRGSVQFNWRNPATIPRSERRVILIGEAI